MQRLITPMGLSSAACIALIALAGCESVSDITRERVARSDAAVKQAQQTVGTEESAAVELQQARDNLAQAQQAVKDNNDGRAQRYAQAAQLDAELAIAKSQSAASRKAAEELTASIEQLRQEAQRTPVGSSETVRPSEPR